jgi:hypothetical protein
MFADTTLQTLGSSTACARASLHTELASLRCVGSIKRHESIRALEDCTCTTLFALFPCDGSPIGCWCQAADWTAIVYVSVRERERRRKAIGACMSGRNDESQAHTDGKTAHMSSNLSYNYKPLHNGMHMQTTRARPPATGPSVSFEPSAFVHRSACHSHLNSPSNQLNATIAPHTRHNHPTSRSLGTSLHVHPPLPRWKARPQPPHVDPVPTPLSHILRYPPHRTDMLPAASPLLMLHVYTAAATATTTLSSTIPRRPLLWRGRV